MKKIYLFICLITLVLTGVSEFANAQFQCSSKEYIYLNDAALGEVHKFEIDPATGQITEIPSKIGPGTPWMSGFDSPHGLGSDLNGNLYIGNHPSNGPIYKMRTDGGTVAADATSWNTTITGGGLTNIGSIDNYIFANGAFNSSEYDKIQVLDACTGDRLGSITLAEATGQDWGMQVLKDGTILVTEGINVGFGNPAKKIWKFDFDPSLINNTTPVPLLIKDGYLNNYDVMWGITTDGTNLYMIAYKGNDVHIVKALASDGSFVAELRESTMSGTSAANPGFAGARGLVYAPTSGKLYVAGFEDCVSIVDAATLTYEGAGAGIVNQTISEPKAIGILKEACPTSTPQTLDLTICSGGNGEKVFLQKLLECDGIISEGIWAETANTSNGGISFVQCDLSITVNGSGCATYKLVSDGSTGLCGPFEITVNICTEVPDATLAGVTGTCTSTTPNNDASISITAAENTNEANFSLGSTYTGPAYNGAGAIAISGTTATITGLAHATEYTVRFFNGKNDCFVDKTFTTPTIDCSCAAPMPTGVAAERCGEGTITLTASGCDATYPARWYSDAALTTQVGTGNSFTTPSITATTDYYVACVQTTTPTCKSAPVTVTATIKSNPTISVSGTPACNVAGTAFDVTYTATAGAMITADKGTVDMPNNMVTGVPSGETVTITATLNGCEATTTATATCAIPCPSPNCGTVTVIKN